MDGCRTPSFIVNHEHASGNYENILVGLESGRSKTWSNSVTQCSNRDPKVLHMTAGINPLTLDLVAHYHRHWELDPSYPIKTTVGARWRKVGARNGASKLHSDFAKLQDEFPELQDELFNAPDDMLRLQNDATSSKTRSPMLNTREKPGLAQGGARLAQGLAQGRGQDNAVAPSFVVPAAMWLCAAHC